jgi:hypothetical protein
MTDRRTPEENLLLAALNVISSMSPAAYRTLRQPSRQEYPRVVRQYMIELVDAVDAVRPGTVDRMFEIIRERETARSEERRREILDRVNAVADKTTGDQPA